jgi:hypothetical protein
MNASNAMTRAIRAASRLGAEGRTSCKRQASGSNPLTGSQGVIRHALEALAADGLIIVRPGRAAVVAGEPGGDPRLSRSRPGPGHDCRRAGCRPHVCHPMKPSTIRGIHSILSGAFAAAQRWEWTERNPAESAKPPTTIRQPIPATSPDDIATVIAEARARNAALGLYLWLVVVTGVRRGELCGLQLRDIDLDRGLVHVAFNYVVRGGQRVRKDTKTHQDRWLAIDPDTCALIASVVGDRFDGWPQLVGDLLLALVLAGAASGLGDDDPGHAGERDSPQLCDLGRDFLGLGDGDGPGLAV